MQGIPCCSTHMLLWSVLEGRQASVVKISSCGVVWGTQCTRPSSWLRSQTIKCSTSRWGGRGTSDLGIISVHALSSIWHCRLLWNCFFVLLRFCCNPCIYFCFYKMLAMWNNLMCGVTFYIHMLRHIWHTKHLVNCSPILKWCSRSLAVAKEVECCIDCSVVPIWDHLTQSCNLFPRYVNWPFTFIILQIDKKYVACHLEKCHFHYGVDEVCFVATIKELLYQNIKWINYGDRHIW